MVRGVNSAAGRQPNSSSQNPGKRIVTSGSKGRAVAIAASQPQRTPLRSLRWTLVFAGVIAVSASLGATIALLMPVNLTQQTGEKAVGFEDLFKNGFQYGISRPVNILVMGIDQGLDTEEAPKGAKGPSDMLSSRSDTMLLVRLDPDTNKANVLTIPRDTKVEIPGLGTEKINAANWKGGAELASEVVSKTLNDVPVDRYLRVSTLAFVELVDVMGGIEVFVPRRMKYDDFTQKLHIDLKPGLQTLNGEQAQGFVRFRHDDLGDIGRTQRQQMLLKALQKKFQNPLMLARLPQIFSVLQKHIDSNMSLGEMLALVQFGVQTQHSQFHMVMLPGRFSAPDEFELSYWLMDPSAMSRVMKTYFETEPVVDPTISSIDEPTTETDNPADLRVVVQNASEDPQGGQRMADVLQQAGYTNISIDEDWPEPLAQTQVVPQWGNLEAAEKLQQSIGNGEIVSDSTGNLRSDLTVRVGRDWAKAQKAAKPQQ
ncbi:LCP family protein [Altericista sp. CCNU0014]|uniref:LCP family protein n=1 Tax=Altericista sp. CCNU0014 TaxID=3082949 RepID=UPI00384FE40F